MALAFHRNGGQPASGGIAPTAVRLAYRKTQGLVRLFGHSSVPVMAGHGTSQLVPVKRQGADGLWRENLDDPNQIPSPETSGTGFFCFGLAWGIGPAIRFSKPGSRLYSAHGSGPGFSGARNDGARSILCEGACEMKLQKNRGRPVNSARPDSTRRRSLDSGDKRGREVGLQRQNAKEI